MVISPRQFIRTLTYGSVSVLMLAALAAPAYAAFDPNDGAYPESKPLPNPNVLFDASAKPTSQNPAALNDGSKPAKLLPLYPTRTVPVAVPAPQVASSLSAPLTEARPAAIEVVGKAPTANTRNIGFVPPAPLEFNPAYSAVEPTRSPQPPVFTPPSSANASNSSPQSPSVRPLPTFSAAADPSVTAPNSMESLATQTKEILSHIPSRLDKVTPVTGKPITISRASHQLDDAANKVVKDDIYESSGVTIKVSRAGLDTNYELTRAYTQLMGGDTEAAISTYKEILSTDPRNQDALFGLATTYHRTGNVDKARPFYGMLLKVNPNHRDGLNNFLALVGDESPQEALAELERLEQRNPDFSPIPAQQAIVLSKLGYMAEAKNKMLRAIELAPSNLTYKYNLAVMLDQEGYYADAGSLYRLLIKASIEGQQVPSSVDAMQKRLNFITTASAQPLSSGS